MKNLFFYIFVSLMFVLSGPVGFLWALDQSQAEMIKPPLEISLDKAIFLVKQKHPDLRLQEINLEKAGQEVRLAVRAFLPDIDLDYIASGSAGGLGLILTAAKILRPLFSLKTLMAEKKIQKILRQREEDMTRLRELDVAQGVKELYATLLVEERLFKLLDENSVSAKKRFELKTALYKEGRLSEEEILEEKLLFDKAAGEARKSETLFQKSQSAFRSLLGLSTDETLLLVSPDIDHDLTFPFSIAECLRLARDKNPLIKAFHLEEEANLAELGKAEPRVTIDGSFIGFGESGGALFSGRPRLGMTGNLVLFDWGKRRIQKNIQALNHEALILKHGKELEGLARAIGENYSNLRILTLEKGITESKLRAASASRRREESLFDAGRATRDDVFEAKAALAAAKVELWQKQIQFWLTRERLLKDLGIPDMAALREIVHS